MANSAFNIQALTDQSIPFWNTANTFSVNLSAPALLGASISYTLPAAPTANGQIIASTIAGLMTWTTSTFPSAVPINQILYASAANTITGLPTAATAVLTTVAGVPTWAAQLSLALGGTNASLVASNGGIFYSTATAGAILAGTATAGQLLTSGASTTPAWTTSTYPATNAINTLLYASGANVMSALATVNSASLVTSLTGVPTWLGPMTNGQIVIGSTGAIPALSTITAGAGIAIVNGASSITISTAGAGFAWQQVLTPTQQLAVANGYINARGAGITYTLPATAALGDTIIILGFNGATTVAQNANQQIFILNASTTIGVGGSIVSNDLGQSITLICVVAGPNTIWDAHPVTGNWAIN